MADDTLKICHSPSNDDERDRRPKLRMQSANSTTLASVSDAISNGASPPVDKSDTSRSCDQKNVMKCSNECAMYSSAFVCTSPSIPSLSLSAPPPLSANGPRLLLVSWASISVAAGMTMARWLVKEAGEVILLFSNTSNDVDADANITFYEVGPNLVAVPESTPSSALAAASAKLGEGLLTFESSPYVRSAPLLLVILSSAAFVLGAILTQSQTKVFLKWFRGELVPSVEKYLDECRNLGKEYSCQFVEATGVSNMDDLKKLLNYRKTLLQNEISKHLGNVVQCADRLIIDDLLRRLVKVGTEFVVGVSSGLALYSIPEDIFPSDMLKSTTNTFDVLASNATAANSSVLSLNSSTICQVKDNNSASNNSEAITTRSITLGSKSSLKSARQRLIRALDPSLESTLFRPGGVWDMFPRGWREYVMAAIIQKDTAIVKGVIPVESNVWDESNKKPLINGTFIEHKATDEEPKDVELSSKASEQSNREENNSGTSGNDEDEESLDTPTANPPADIKISNEFKKNIDEKEIDQALIETHRIGMTSNERHNDYNQVVTWTNKPGAKLGASGVNGCEEKGPVEDAGAGETIGEALTSVVKQIVASNLTVVLRGKKEDPTGTRFFTQESNSTHYEDEDELKEHKDEQQPLLSPFQLQLEQFLRHTAISTTLLFLFHLRRSTTTRKAWWAAAQFSASLGLVATAVSSAIGSRILRSDSINAVTSSNPIAVMLCSRVTEVLGPSSSLFLYSSLEKKLRSLLNRFQSELKNNQGLQTAVALAVLYSIGKLRNRLSFYSTSNARRRRIRLTQGRKGTR